MRRVALILAAGLAGQAALAQGFDPAELAFVQRQGCVVGPEGLQEAVAEGLDPERLERSAQRAVEAGQAREAGAVVLLGPDLCRIDIPEVRSPISVRDADIRAVTSAPDAFADQGFPGCFLRPPQSMPDYLAESRGWTRDEATIAYLRFLTEHLRTGEIALYSDSILTTPPGFQVLVGAGCRSVSNLPQIRESQDWLARNFGRLVRALFETEPCDGSSPSFAATAELAQELGIRADQTNGQVLVEALFIVMGSGWVDGISAQERGQARPPLCHPARAE